MRCCARNIVASTGPTWMPISLKMRRKFLMVIVPRSRPDTIASVLAESKGGSPGGLRARALPREVVAVEPAVDLVEVVFRDGEGVLLLLRAVVWILERRRGHDADHARVLAGRHVALRRLAQLAVQVDCLL